MTAFLVYRYAVVVAVALGILGVIRYRSVALGLALVGALGVLSWVFTWAPLERPYRLEPGTDTSLDYAVVSSGAARGALGEGWVSGTRNPRPAWSLLWFASAPRSPERARALVPWTTPLLMVLIPGAVLALMRSRGPWAALACAFTAVLAASVPIDAFAPYALFHGAVFFDSAHRAFGLLVALAALIALERGPWPRLAAGGALLGLLGSLDLALFAWTLLVSVFRAVTSAGRRAWLPLLFGSGLAAPQMLVWLRGELLLRIPSTAEVEAYRLAFRDPFAATADMGWLFVLAICSFWLVRDDNDGLDVGIFSILSGSYALWLGAAVWYQFRPLAEPGFVFHLLRFGTGIAAGSAGFEIARRLIVRLEWARKWSSIEAPGPLAFACLVVFLLPTSAAFLWRPLQLDPLYYQGTYEWDPSVRRLEAWVLENTDPDDIFLTGDETGEWVASLTGRRVLTAPRVLDRDEMRRRRRLIRGLFLSNDPETMRESVEAMGTRVLVLDPELREAYWQLDESKLEGVGLFEKVHQIGDRYSIYLESPR